MSSDLQIYGFIGFVAAHIVLVALARKWNALYLIACAFLILSPLSAATDFPFVEPAKLARVYASVLIVLVGVAGFGIRSLGPSAKSLAAFFLVYTLAAVWSDEPLAGLLYKTYCSLAIAAGVFLAYGVRNIEEFGRGMRLLCLTAGIAAALAFVVFVTQPEEVDIEGRMAIGGLNANRIGETASPLFLLCSYVALYNRSKTWKAYCAMGCAILLAIIVASGSRAAFAMVVVGVAVQLTPIVKRPAYLFLGAGSVLLLTYVLTTILATEVSAERLWSTMDTRQRIWRSVSQNFIESPLLGKGWAHTQANTQANCHSAYLQVVVETGLLGIFVMVSCLVAALASARRMHRSFCKDRVLSPLLYLAESLLLGVLVHGIAESTALAGSTPNSLMLGLGAGLLDRLPYLAAQQRRLVFSNATGLVASPAFLTTKPTAVHIG